MSFILDALRRAETQRGVQPAPAVKPDSALHDIADKPSAMPSLRWISLFVVAAVAIALLAMNLPDRRDSAGTMTPDTRQATSTQTPSFPTIAPDTPLAQVAMPATREVRPLLREAQPSRNVPPPVAPTESAPPPATPGTVTYSQERLSGTEPGTRTLTNVQGDLPSRDESLLSYAETIIRGNELPEFHLDIHVYAADPARRFVFVNNRKYREGQQLHEGGTVERITPAGVVLNHRGYRFELPPD